VCGEQVCVADAAPTRLPRDLADRLSAVRREDHAAANLTIGRLRTNAKTYPPDPVKRCTKCGEEKPRAEFRRDRSRKDGRYPQCKACEKEWREANAERLTAYHRTWNRANPAKKRAHDRRYREKKLAEDAEQYRQRKRVQQRRYQERNRAASVRRTNRRAAERPSAEAGDSQRSKARHSSSTRESRLEIGRNSDPIQRNT
jgi:hypothetical protein